MIDMVDSHLDGPLTLQGLAKLAHVSRAHFVRRFRAVTGVSPHRYITMRRIEKAKQLLLHTSTALSEIGPAVGFAHQSHFTQPFHAETGITPVNIAALRRLVRE
jgi:AraC family transcriptional regulator